jgi:hypothetical protein
VRVALDVRPNAVLLASDRREGRVAASPLDFRTGAGGLSSILRTLSDAGIAVAALVSPTLEAVKTAHANGLMHVELYTGALVDLPANERRKALDALGGRGAARREARSRARARRRARLPVAARDDPGRARGGARGGRPCGVGRARCWSGSTARCGICEPC